MLDHHELAALLARRQVRDLFDSHRVLQMGNLDSRGVIRENRVTLRFRR